MFACWGPTGQAAEDTFEVNANVAGYKLTLQVAVPPPDMKSLFVDTSKLTPPETPALLDNTLLCLPAGVAEALGLVANMEDKGEEKRLWFGRAWQLRALDMHKYKQLPMLNGTGTPLSKKVGDDRPWRFRCIHAEGMSAEKLSDIPSELRSFTVQAGAFGRKHQPQLILALLGETSPCVPFISRTHVQLNPCAGSGLSATNMSPNPIYVDREHLAKGESRTLKQDQVLSFARLENGSHVFFLQFQVGLQPAVEAAKEDLLKRPPASPCGLGSLLRNFPPPKQMGVVLGEGGMLTFGDDLPAAGR